MTRLNHAPLRRRLALALPLLALPLSIQAAGEPGVHSHGTARIQLAIEGSRMDLYIVSPADNLLGFEHEAQNDEQKQQVEATTDWLGGHPLIALRDGDCSITRAVVDKEGSQDTEKDDHGHSHDHDHAHEESAANHRDFRVDQSIECDSSIAGRDLYSRLFEAFDGFETVTVEWVSGTAQGSARLTSAEDDFTVRE